MASKWKAKGLSDDKLVSIMSVCQKCRRLNTMMASRALWRQCIFSSQKKRRQAEYRGIKSMGSLMTNHVLALSPTKLYTEKRIIMLLHRKGKLVIWKLKSLQRMVYEMKMQWAGEGDLLLLRNGNLVLWKSNLLHLSERVWKTTV